MTSRAFSSLLLVAALLGPALADAQQGEAAGWGYSLAHELMSPFCPGRTLAQCTSPQAQQLRQWILMQEAAGASRDEVQANLFERYGDAIRSAPKAEGWGLSAYVLPLVFFLGGGGLLFFFLRRLVRKAPRPAAPGFDADSPAPRGSALQEAELERLVDEELGLVR